MPDQHMCCIAPSDIFPGTEVSLEHLRDTLSPLNRAETLIYCARWILIFCDTKTSHADKQGKAMDWFLSREQKGEMIRLSGGPEKVAFSFRGGLCELMRWAALFCDPNGCDPHFYGEEQFSRRNQLGKAMMIANQCWLRSVGTDMFPDLEGDALRLATLVRMRLNVAGTRVGRDPSFSLGTGYSIFNDRKFFQKFYKNALKEFQDLTGKSMQEYFVCSAWIVSNMLNKTLEQVTTQQNHNGIFSLGAFIDPVKREKFKPILRDFYEKNKQSPEQMKNNFWNDTPVPSNLENLKPVDEMVIRNFPILEVDDGRAIIIDPVLYAETVATGPLFTLVRNPSKNRNEKDNIMAMFGKTFEEYVISLFRAMYRPRSARREDAFYPNPEGKAAGNNRVQIADACVLGNDEAVLVEAKAAFIKWPIIMDRDNEKYLEALNEKYVDDKGVAQLSNSITNLANGSWQSIDISFNNIRRIFPVLLVYDHLMDAFSHSWYLNTKFREALNPDSTTAQGEYVKGNFIIAPLTLITLDDFQNFETTVRRGLSLRKFLNDYTIAHPERICSLTDYIAFSEYKNKFFGSVEVGKYTVKILAVAHDALFPWTLRRIIKKMGYSFSGAKIGVQEWLGMR